MTLVTSLCWLAFFLGAVFLAAGYMASEVKSGDAAAEFAKVGERRLAALALAYEADPEGAKDALKAEFGYDMPGQREEMNARISGGLDSVRMDIARDAGKDWDKVDAQDIRAYKSKMDERVKSLEEQYGRWLGIRETIKYVLGPIAGVMLVFSVVMSLLNRARIRRKKRRLIEMARGESQSGNPPM